MVYHSSGVLYCIRGDTFQSKLFISVLIAFAFVFCCLFRAYLGLQRAFLGSVSEYLAHNAPCSVLVYRCDS